MAQERMYNLAHLNTEQDIVHKKDFTDIADLFTAAKRGKDSKCFYKDLQFWNSFSCISVPKFLLLLVQFDKILLFQFFVTFAFSNVIHVYKAKV